MKAAALMVIIAALGAAQHAGAAELMTNIDGRKVTRLDGEWHAIVDPYENGYYDYRLEPLANGFFKNEKPEGKSDRIEYDFDASATLRVPGDWNTQRPELFLYEGTVWYEKTFDYAKPLRARLFVHFGAVSQRAVVYLNGERLGEHDGGFTPFDFEITDRVRPTGNFLVVKVDNVRRRDGVPTVNTDWWNYGGITRPVSLVEVPETYVADYVVQLRKGSMSEIAGWVRLAGSHLQQEVTIEIPEAGVARAVATDTEGYASFQFPARVSLWSPESPRLYDVSVVAETDRVRDSIGFRSIEVEGTDVLLNGKPIFLRGVSAHEETPLHAGRAYSAADARILLGWVKEMGGNFVRLAHYPHSESMTREADRLGVLVWSEVPVYWTIQWDNPATFDNARAQVSENVIRDRNRASIILWSVGNETPIGEARTSFLTRLVERVRELDPTRLVTAALEIHYVDETTLLIDDPLGRQLDVLGCNEYIGWYVGLPEMCDRVQWKSAYDKPLVMSEFGGAAAYGHHGDDLTRWTEEYQESLYEHQVAMLKRIPFLRGTTPWILMDFRSPRRQLPKIQDFFNRKGLISERGERKKAFFVMRRFYDELDADASSEREAGPESSFIPASYAGTPFGDARHPEEPQKLPGRLQCELYDRGGPGVAYQDSDDENSGSGRLNPLDGSYLNGFRADEAVDISYTKDTGDTTQDFSEYNRVTPDRDSLYVGWTAEEEWLRYTVVVGETGTYSLDVRYTSNGDGAFEVSVDGDPRGTVALPTTNDPADPVDWRQWHHWNEVVDALGLELPAGRHLVRVRMLAGNTNLDYLEFRLR